MYDLTIYTDDELKKIQEIERKCLEVIIKVCEKIDVEYFLIGGSALGAVRHNGFIPWDDDIDVGMTRENYKKFLKNASLYLPEKYYLQTPYKNSQCPYYYSKVRVDNTEFIEYCNRKVSMHQGVYVDIFPFDEVPDDDGMNKKQFNRIQKLIRIFTLRQSPDLSKKPECIKDNIQYIFRKIIHYFCRFYNYTKLTKTLEKEITQYNGTGQHAIACLNFPVRKKEYIKISDLYPLRDCMFENLTVKIPNNYDKYLNTHYGDYMKLPPQNQRYGHKPYKVYLGE